MVSPGPGPGPRLFPSSFATSDIMVGTFIENMVTVVVRSSTPPVVSNRCAKGLNPSSIIS